MTEHVINLVADIGGTNLRIGVVDEEQGVNNLDVYQCRDYFSLYDVINHYLAKYSLLGKKINACFAIACPVDNDVISMTNLPWSFSKTELKSALALNELLFINDYTAIAHAVPFLTGEQKVQIGTGNVVKNKPIAICGPGTGLGVANVVPVGQHWHSLGGEGGHVDFAPIDQNERDILSFLSKKYQHVSYEQLLSGLGLEQIYQALNEKNSHKMSLLSAKQITERALTNDCSLSTESLEQFCKVLGSFAGNLALTMSSFGGVYIAGGIVPRFIEFFKQSKFRSRFESKGRFVAFNQAIPTFVITESQPGIIGAAAYLRQYNLQNKG